MASEKAALRAFVTTPLNTNASEDSVKLDVSHSLLKQRFSEIRFSLFSSVETIKEKLSQQTGTFVDAMVLQLFDTTDKLIATLQEPDRLLGFYSPTDGCRLHVIDLNPTSLASNGWLEDVSLVKKFEISEEEYNKRDDTYRKFKEQRLAADPNWSLVKEMELRRGGAAQSSTPSSNTEYMADLASKIKVGDRCQVEPGDRRGEVAYTGTVDDLPAGHWIGIVYDEPVGKHDGEVKGRRYFSCPPGYGSFVRPDKVKVGDYPERDLFDDDEDEI